MTCTVGRGWNTLSEAADFWLVKDINEAEAQFYMEEEATANRLKMKQASAAATKRANDVTAATANYSTCPHDDERSNLNNGHQKNQACETSSQPSMLITNDALIHQEEPIHPQVQLEYFVVELCYIVLFRDQFPHFYVIYINRTKQIHVWCLRLLHLLVM